MIIFFLFFIGACVGSFLGVLIERLPKDQPIFLDRSKCDYCGKTLSWQALIPIVSYLWFRGNSQCCHKHLSLFYPVIELLTGILLIVCYLYAPSLPQTVFLYIIGCILLVIFFTDLFEGVIPVLLVLLGVIITCIYYFFFHISFISPLLGVFVATGLFGLLVIGTKGKGMGLGDVCFAVLMGILLGFPNIITGLYIAFLTGAIVSLILVVTKKKKLKGGSVPFVPFLIFATVFTYVYGSVLTAYFASFFPHF
jgi:prepilin signal peptidase PulO-like enzyme (type II secretory pathway)